MAFDLALGKIQRDWSCGSDPLIWTPSSAKGELDSLRNLLDITNSEMSEAVKQKKVNSEEWNLWWQTYQTVHKFTTSASPYWGSNMDTAKKHKDDVLLWRELLQSRGVQGLAPKSVGKQKDEPLSLTQSILLGSGMIASAAFLISVIKK